MGWANSVAAQAIRALRKHGPMPAYRIAEYVDEDVSIIASALGYQRSIGNVRRDWTYHPKGKGKIRIALYSVEEDK